MQSPMLFLETGKIEHYHRKARGTSSFRVMVQRNNAVGREDYSSSCMTSCIPSNACYLFAIGDAFYSIYNEDHASAATISMDDRIWHIVKGLDLNIV
jgi:hypothetical protein